MLPIVGTGERPSHAPPRELREDPSDRLAVEAAPFRLRPILNSSIVRPIMKRIWTIIGVGDVARSLRWYQSLLGQRRTRPAHSDFGQVVDADGTVLLALHQWGAEEHPPLMSPSAERPGNGLLLFFLVDDYDRALKRARSLLPRLEEEPHVNPNTRALEFSLRDPDGYYVTISAFSPPPPRKRPAKKRSGAPKTRPRR